MFRFPILIHSPLLLDVRLDTLDSLSYHPGPFANRSGNWTREKEEKKRRTKKKEDIKNERKRKRKRQNYTTTNFPDRGVTTRTGTDADDWLCQNVLNRQHAGNSTDESHQGGQQLPEPHCPGL